ncbi:MAG: hypothetical protein IJC94_04620 [Oscillospiraceae bacterium]|nr:hypothetical protein [Oscillospiraceae bacterium]
MKKGFYTELSYLFGIIILAVGTAFMTTTDLGLSMVVAPAYILHRKISETFSFFSFGMAEYTLQAFLIILTAAAMKKFKLSYLFSFITAVFYGFVLDGSLLLMGLISQAIASHIAFRIALYVFGFFVVAFAVSLLFHTYIPPEAYELIVKEISHEYRFSIGKTKTVYDCVSCAAAIILSFAFFGLWHFEGISIGTVLCALFNGLVISRFNKLLDKHFDFKDKFGFRKYFE